METGLSGGYANQLRERIFSGGDAGSLSAASGACRDSRCLAAQSGFAGDLLHGCRLERERLRPGLYSEASAALACELCEYKVRIDSVRMEGSIRKLPEANGLSFYFAPIGIPEDG